MTGILEKHDVNPGVSYYFNYFWQPVKSEGKTVDFSDLTLEDCSGTMTGFTLEPINLEPVEETEDCYAGVAVTFKATMDAEYDFTFAKPYIQADGLYKGGSTYTLRTWGGSNGSWEGTLPPANLIDNHGNVYDSEDPNAYDLIFGSLSEIYTDSNLTNKLTSAPVDGGE